MFEKNYQKLQLNAENLEIAIQHRQNKKYDKKIKKKQNARMQKKKTEFICIT